MVEQCEERKYKIVDLRNEDQETITLLGSSETPPEVCDNEFQVKSSLHSCVIVFVFLAMFNHVAQAQRRSLGPSRVAVLQAKTRKGVEDIYQGDKIMMNHESETGQKGRE